jgi:hypothetical protein
MGHKDDIRKRMKKLNPKALALMDKMDAMINKSAGKSERSSGVVVTTTEDMTPEEEEMELFAGFLKEGYPEDEAAKKAKEWLALMKQMFDKDKK